jgi:hypothetical protein
VELQAYIRPSSGGAWSKCAGFAALCAALGSDFIEEQDNEVRDDGIACHWLAEQLWNGAVISPGSIAPNGRELTDEMFAAVAEYHARIRAWGAAHIAIEQRVPVATYFPGVQDGTPDVWGYDPGDCALYLADLKFGYRPVDVWRNIQMILYIWTLICWLLEQGHTIGRIEISIFQPRVAHRDGYWREWKPTIAELAGLVPELQAAALRCYEPNPMCTVNPACRNCGGASACVTLQAAAGAGMEVSYDATPLVLTEQQVGYELTRLMQAQRHIEHRITGLETQAESLLRKGKRIPGFEMGRKATRYRWRAGTEKYVRRLGELFGVAVTEEEPKVRTVAQLRNAFPIDVQALYAEKPTGELKLVATDPNEATRRFSQS